MKQLIKNITLGMAALLLAGGLVSIVLLSGCSLNDDSVSQQVSSEEASHPNGLIQNNEEEQAETQLSDADNTVHLNQVPDSTFLYETDIAEINHADAYLDGQTVQIRGEVVGDLINDEYDAQACWINVQDDDKLNPSTAIARITRDQASVIDSYGSYSTRGTIVQVRGTFNLECSEHEGISDIHAEEVQLVSQGSRINHPVSPIVATAGVLCLGTGLVLLIVYSVARERTR